MNEPLVARGRLTLALGQFVRGEERVALLPLASTPTEEYLAHLASLATATPLVTIPLADTSGAARVQRDDPAFEVLRYAQREEMRALPTALRRALNAVIRRSEEARIEAICNEVVTTGVMTEPALAQRLGCAEEDIILRLAVPSAQAACQRRNLEYIEGFGLCTREMLSRVRRAASEMRELRDNPQVGNAWMMRTLGRRLREVTGAHEGIECLIAWLGAA
jgi:hypothetical protein